MSLAESNRLDIDSFLALPEDDIERELIRGELRERPMTQRNPHHSESMAMIGYLLLQWLERQPEPRGRVVVGEAGFRIRRNPDTFVGIDVAYASPDLAIGKARKRKFFDGPPVLAVEILSPSDQHGDIVEKISVYLEVGTTVWVVDPDLRTLAVHRPGEPPVTFNDEQEFSGEPYLPGFRVAVARLFGS